MSENPDRVSRRRYDREKAARAEAELLLERKSRELFEANLELSKHSEQLEHAVTERTAELSEALQKAEAASAARSRFIATMSHEIRTPLGGLLGMIDLLALDETDPEKQELLSNAKVSGVSLKRIVNDVLDFSKMEAGLFVFQREQVDIRALIKSVLVLAQTELTKNGRAVEALIDKDVPQLFVGDATRIRQVISNLVTNAVRYSAQGPITIRVQSSLNGAETLLRLEVQDHGVGIASSEIDSLFKDFSQISNPLTSIAEGTGLGLAISKRIIEGCGGSIGVLSELSKGSTFWVELPVETIEQPNVSPDSTIEESAKAGSGLKGVRVLLAEDNAINQKLLLAYLERMGIETVLAENGRIVLEKFAPNRFDLILMDVAMPVMDGISATRHLRAQWTSDELPPIIVLTAHVMDAIEEDASSVGVQTVLSKPIPFDELRMAIELAVSNSKEPQPDGAMPPSPPGFISLMSDDIAAELQENFTPDKLTDLVLAYLGDSRERLVGIKKFHARGQIDAARREAHSLKGSSRLLGFDPVGDIAAEIETSMTSLNVEKVAEMVNAISEHLTRLESLIS